jgi:ornithine cyclodeaminase
MDVLIADQQLVTELLPMPEAIVVMRDALRRLREPDTILPLRDVVALPGGERVLSLMPAYLGGLGTLGVKVITGFPANFGGEFDTHQGVVLVFDDDHGRLRAIVDATSITAIRTAAVSGVATDLLATPGAGDLALIGAGTQAHTHLAAMGCVRRLRRVRVFSMPAGSGEAFARREERLTGLHVEVTGSAEEAVRGADIVCTVTTATEPVLRGDWLAPGAHVNAVGAYSPTTRELDSRAVARARLYVDRREATRSEAGEFLIARAEGAIGDDHIVGEIGEALTGAAPGRGADDEITLFKSLGLAVEDLAAARHVLDKARERGAGAWIEIGGRHFGSAADD